MDRIRLSEFTKWIGEERETFRSILNRGDAPIHKSRPGEAQRTYDGADLLAWCVFNQLRQRGVAPRIAGQAVLNSDLVSCFLTARAKGEDVSDWHLILWSRRRDRGALGIREYTDHTFGDSEDVAEILREETEGYGQPNYSGDIKLGISSLVAVPVNPCYERCKTTAKAQGFELRGPDLYELDRPEGT